jgi:hypothetical protein
MLAGRIEQGAAALLELAESLTEAEWHAIVPGDGRSVGVVVHHVASVYPIEVKVAKTIASGHAIENVTWDGIDQMNAGHAADHATAGKAATLQTLRDNSRAAAETVRGLSDEELDTAAPVSLYSGAPLTAQFFIEDHALRHSFHHLARIRSAVGR